MAKTVFQNQIEKKHGEIKGRLPLADILASDIGVAKTIQLLCDKIEELENRIIILEKK